MTTVGPEPFCDLCDLPLNQCEHGLGQKQRHARQAVHRLEVSPQRMAHYPGCSHNAGGDYSAWSYVTGDTEAAWVSLGNHRPVDTDRVGVQATSRCSDCDAHGPWV